MIKKEAKQQLLPPVTQLS